MVVCNNKLNKLQQSNLEYSVIIQLLNKKRHHIYEHARQLNYDTRFIKNGRGIRYDCLGRISFCCHISRYSQYLLKRHTAVFNEALVLLHEMVFFASST